MGDHNNRITRRISRIIPSDGDAPHAAYGHAGRAPSNIRIRMTSKIVRNISRPRLRIGDFPSSPVDRRTLLLVVRVEERLAEEGAHRTGLSPVVQHLGDRDNLPELRILDSAS